MLVLSYIGWCVRFCIRPWKYFQLNANYFNQEKGIFSKLDMDSLIPEKWRLKQCVDHVDFQPDSYPVFVKPEWGQNSQGIVRADNLQQLNEHRQQRSQKGPRYLVQNAAKGRREFEIFYIPGAKANDSSAIVSVIETCNNSKEEMPINGINNTHTYYQSRMAELTAQQIKKIEAIVSSIGSFKIARYCARADSLEALLDEQFSIVEINIYVPMPLTLLVKEISLKAKLTFILKIMKQLALVTKEIPESQVVKSVFFRKLHSAHLLKNSAKNRHSA
jgi:hypothetical protein